MSYIVVKDPRKTGVTVHTDKQEAAQAASTCAVGEGCSYFVLKFVAEARPPEKPKANIVDFDDGSDPWDPPY